jgi:hypothetical protein
MLLFQSSLEKCWICGTDSDLTREHLVKSSELRRYGANLGFDVLSNDGKLIRYAQGVKSDKLKFNSKICGPCNSSTTQRADFVYDNFIKRVSALGGTVSAVNTILSGEEFRSKSGLRIDLERYFAKLIGCHLAESKAPITKHLTKLVRSQISTSRITISAQDTSSIKGSEVLIGTGFDESRLGHGGLAVYLDARLIVPKSVLSYRSIGKSTLLFRYQFSILEKIELLLRFKSFVQSCRASAEVDRQWN